MTDVAPTAEQVATDKVTLANYENEIRKTVNIEQEEKTKKSGILALAVGGVVMFAVFLALFIGLIVSEHNNFRTTTDGAYLLGLVFFVGWAVGPSLMWSKGIDKVKKNWSDAQAKYWDYQNRNKGSIEAELARKAKYPELYK